MIAWAVFWISDPSALDQWLNRNSEPGEEGPDELAVGIFGPVGALGEKGTQHFLFFGVRKAGEDT